MTDLVDCKTKDYLEQDPDIRGQKYACVSFISPEDVIKQKETFLFTKFLGAFATDLKDFFTNMSERFAEDQTVLDMLKGLEQKYDYVFGHDELQTAYNFFKTSNSDKLEADFHALNNFKTSIRGLKIRGSYETIQEAQKRAEAIKKFDPAFDVYVAQVGCWCPWAPNPEDITDVEYSETQLNTLMKKYKENQEKKDELYRLRRDDMIQSVKMHADREAEAKPGISIVTLDDEEATVAEIKQDIEEADAWAKKQEENN